MAFRDTRAPATLALAAFLLVVTLVEITKARRGTFRIDEAHKISETAFFGLWLSGDFADPAWRENIVDRTNPPVGKYLFGAAIAASGGTIPSMPTLSVQSPDGSIPPYHDASLTTRYRPLLGSARFISTLATALTAAAIAFLLARLHNLISAIAAVALYLANFLTQTFWATAVFDPLLTLFFALTLGAAALAHRERPLLSASVVGLLSALAFQTRLNGALAFVLALVIASFRIRKPRQLALFVALSISVLAAATLLLNPYYWSSAGNEALVVRPPLRLVDQLHDISTLQEKVRVGSAALRTPGAKVHYLFEMAFGDVSGVVLCFASIAGAAIASIGWRKRSAQLNALLVSAMLASVTYILWLPLAWPRYLLVVIPQLAIVGGFAFGSLAEMVSKRTRERTDA